MQSSVTPIPFSGLVSIQCPFSVRRLMHQIAIQLYSLNHRCRTTGIQGISGVFTVPSIKFIEPIIYLHCSEYLGLTKTIPEPSVDQLNWCETILKSIKHLQYDLLSDLNKAKCRRSVFVVLGYNSVPSKFVLYYKHADSDYDQRFDVDLSIRIAKMYNIQLLDISNVQDLVLLRAYITRLTLDSDGLIAEKLEVMADG